MSFAFYNNIVYWKKGRLHVGNWNDNGQFDFAWCGNPVRPPRKNTQTILCDYNVYYNPALELKEVKFGSKDVPLDVWRETFGKDRHSVYSDPMSRDAANHDYTLLPGSPALKMGFEPIDVSEIGPRR